MTTISPRRRRAPLGRLAALGGIALLIIVAVVWRAPLSSLVWRALSPAMAWRESLNGGAAALLRAELASTTAALADRDALAAENALLKKELGRETAPRTLAVVIARPPGVPYDTLIIDIGQDHGVTPGALVYAPGNALIGQVSDVYASTARVMLISAPGQTYQALINGSVPISVLGQGAGSMTGEVPAQTTVAVGDTVLFSTIGGGFMGRVSRVDSLAGESFERVYMQLPVDLFSLRFVFVEAAHV